MLCVEVTSVPVRASLYEAHDLRDLLAGVVKLRITDTLAKARQWRLTSIAIFRGVPTPPDSGIRHTQPGRTAGIVAGQASIARAIPCLR